MIDMTFDKVFFENFSGFWSSHFKKIFIGQYVA